MTLTKVVEIGDYIKMTPTSTSYSVPSEANVWGTHTGYSSDQTIKPSELNLWRVIKVNTDGTIEVVSEYISSTKVTYRGGTGYSTLVSSLNNIAAQYVNSNFTSGSRYMGYNGQTEDGSVSFDLSMFCETDDNSSEEEYGCGDVLYEKDTNLVTIAVGTLKANIVNTSTSGAYFLASRYSYHRENDDMTFTEDSKGARYVSSSGSVLSSPLYYNLYDENDYSTTDNNDVSYYLRPILILKADLYATGSGTSASPYVLE